MSVYRSSIMEQNAHEHDHDYISSFRKNSNVLELNQYKSSDTISNNELDNWQTVKSRNTKRNITSLLDHGLKRHCLSKFTKQRNDDPIQLSNSYELLSSNKENSMDEDKIVTINLIQNLKPPPNVLVGVKNVSPMIKGLRVSKTEYSYKCLNQHRVKLFPSSPNTHRKIVKGLTHLDITAISWILLQEQPRTVEPIEDCHNSTA
ncbi:hypothetical protein J6590_022687 [Homalodisca vitripennis]|nr:hypothetical protein J6590_022687 [Homalodisca vitripennis]